MITVDLQNETDFEGWRSAARTLLQHDIDPCDVNWRTPRTPQSLLDISGQTLLDLPILAYPKDIKASAKFIEISRRAICHRDPERFSRLYGLLVKLQSQPRFLSNTTNKSVIWLTDCDKAIRRDRHKMHAFVRFRKTGVGAYKREQFAAWFEPEHYITELATPFFMRRFPNMDWIIVTPDCTAVWDGQNLCFSDGGCRTDVPSEDAVEEQWKTYFASIFNPARLKVGAMMSEMPKKYWKNLPEAADIPEMIRLAQGRMIRMQTEAVTTPNPLAAKLSDRK